MTRHTEHLLPGPRGPGREGRTHVLGGQLNTAAPDPETRALAPQLCHWCSRCGLGQASPFAPQSLCGFKAVAPAQGLGPRQHQTGSRYGYCGEPGTGRLRPEGELRSRGHGWPCGFLQNEPQRQEALQRRTPARCEGQSPRGALVSGEKARGRQSSVQGAASWARTASWSSSVCPGLHRRGWRERQRHLSGGRCGNHGLREARRDSLLWGLSGPSLRAHGPQVQMLAETRKVAHTGDADRCGGRGAAESRPSGRRSLPRFSSAPICYPYGKSVCHSHRLNRVPKRAMLGVLVPINTTLFGNGVFAEVIKLK